MEKELSDEEKNMKFEMLLHEIKQQVKDKEDSEENKESITARLLTKIMNTLFPDKQTNESLRTITRLNETEILVLSLGNSADKLRIEMGLKPMYPEFNIHYMAGMISKDGEGRTESIDTAKIANEAANIEEQNKLKERALTALGFGSQRNL